MKISVIVPVYNNEKYIEKTIRSITEQSFSDFEIVIVDDGSSDKSGLICDKFAKNDDRIKVIHKENGGVSSARNAGIDIAAGKYIAFVDGDDTVSVDYLEKLYKNIDGCQLSIGSAEMICHNSDKIDLLRVPEKFYTVEEFKNALECFSAQHINSIWNKLYVADIIKTTKLKFMNDIRIGEDAIFSMQYIEKCDRIHGFQDVIYKYNIGYNTSKHIDAKEYFEEKKVMLKTFREFYQNTSNENVKSLLILEYLSTIKEYIISDNDKEKSVKIFTDFISEMDLDRLIMSNKIMFIKKVFAYKWLVLLQKHKYNQYVKEYIFR